MNKGQELPEQIDPWTGETKPKRQPWDKRTKAIRIFLGTVLLSWLCNNAHMGASDPIYVIVNIAFIAQIAFYAIALPFFLIRRGVRLFAQKKREE